MTVSLRANVQVRAKEAVAYVPPTVPSNDPQRDDPSLIKSHRHRRWLTLRVNVRRDRAANHARCGPCRISSQFGSHGWIRLRFAV